MKKKSLLLQKQIHAVPQLDRALSQFDLSATKLKQSFESLQDDIGTLNLELERENRELERNLREKEGVKNYLYSILESLPTGVLVVNGVGRVITFNRAAERITGMQKTEVEGKDCNHVLGPLLPPDFPRIVARTDTDSCEGECVLRKHTGREVDVQFSIVPLRERMNGELAGAESALVILHDITQIKKLEEQAGRTNRLTAMGEIAVSIAHEVRNPLGSIELLASLIRQDIEADDDKRRRVDYILNGVKSINCIITNLLLFSKPHLAVLKRVSLHRFLDEVLLFCGPSLKQSQVELIKHLDRSGAVVMADAELLKQAFLNIIWNALQAMPGGGNLIVATDMAGFCTGRSEAGQYVEISFADSGTGMADDIKQKIFDPFFTTKEKGAGLGLAIVHNIIEAHGGMIGVTSREGKGSTFTITMPHAGAGEREEGDG